MIVKNNTNEVVDGNRRLAAYRLLYQENPLRWGIIYCEILPENITKNQILRILVEVNLKKAKPLSSFEIARWLWRLSNEG